MEPGNDDALVIGANTLRDHLSLDLSDILRKKMASTGTAVGAGEQTGAEPNCRNPHMVLLRSLCVNKDARASETVEAAAVPHSQDKFHNAELELWPWCARRP